MASLALDTDSEDDLPAGWEERVAVTGKVYYANHNLKGTQWEHPITGKKKKVAGERHLLHGRYRGTAKTRRVHFEYELPYGWERKVNETGHIYYVDHISKKTTYTDPRLAFAVEDKQTTSRGHIKQRFDGSSTAQQVLLGRDLTGRFVVITGGNSGIGFETARSLALHGAHVTIACRNMKSACAAVAAIMKERPQAKMAAMSCDLTSLASVAKFVESYQSKGWPLHVLILNAGVFSLPYTRTEDGYEAVFQTNHLGHFYLTRLLMELLIQSAPSRVVTVTSESHRFTDLNAHTICEEKLSPPQEGYRAILAYNQSKLCNVLFSMELQRRLQKLGVSCMVVHPGNMVSTGITRHWWLWTVLFTLVRPFTKSKCVYHARRILDLLQQQAAATIVYCATARELEGHGGGYFNNCFQCPPGEEGLVPRTAELLWELSEQMITKATEYKAAGHARL